MNQMLELYGKDFKAAIIKTLQKAVTNPLEINVKVENLTQKMEFIF